jgi:hypothetical protein
MQGKPKAATQWPKAANERHPPAAVLIPTLHLSPERARKMTATRLLAAVLLASFLCLGQLNASAQTTSCPAPTSPGVAICSPENNSDTTAPVHVVASATGNAPISYMQIYINSVKYATYHGTNHIDVQVSTAARGATIGVLAKDTNGQNYVSYVSTSIYGSTVGCDTTDPGTVKICSPYASEINGSTPQDFRVVAVAASSAGIKYSQIFINGVKYATYYTDHLDTMVHVATTGITRLAVQAKDNAGATIKTNVYLRIR